MKKFKKYSLYFSKYLYINAYNKKLLIMVKCWIISFFYKLKYSNA